MLSPGNYWFYNYYAQAYRKQAEEWNELLEWLKEWCLTASKEVEGMPAYWLALAAKEDENKRKIIETIESLPDPFRSLMKLYYLHPIKQQKKLEEVGNELGYSAGYTRQLHLQALKEFEKKTKDA